MHLAGIGDLLRPSSFSWYGGKKPGWRHGDKKPENQRFYPKGRIFDFGDMVFSDILRRGKEEKMHEF